VFEIIRIL